MRASAAATWALSLTILVFASCESAPVSAGAGTALTMRGSAAAPGLQAHLEAGLARGTPAALAGALELLDADGTLTPSESALFRWYAVELGRIVYPEIHAATPSVPEPPPGHPWVRAFADARTGRILSPRAGAEPLELLALASALFRGDSRETNRAASLALDILGQARTESPLADHLRGVVAERAGKLSEAYSWYVSAFVSAPDCYPALFGTARTLLALGRADEAVNILRASQESFGVMHAWARLMALALFNSGRFEAAGPYVIRILGADPLDTPILLLRAELLVRAGEYRQAIPLLNAYEAVESSDRRFLLLRGRVAWEGSRNRDEALRYLRRLLSIYPDDNEGLLAAARILAQGNAADRGEAYLMAGRVLAVNPTDTPALSLVLAEDIRNRDWPRALASLERLRAASPGYWEPASMHLVYRSAGRHEDAFQVASAWREAQPDSEDARLALIRSLVDRRDAAAARNLIMRSLTEKGSARYRSALFFLQSLVQTSDEAVMSSLRSSLVENVQNLESLTAMFDVYMRMKDSTKARFYLRQALAVAPDDPGLARRRDELVRLGLAP